MNQVAQKIVAMIAFGTFALVIGLGELRQAQAQQANEPYPSMAPLDQYLMDRNAEIALARSAAPPSVSNDATVMIFARRGYETAVEGKNGFVSLRIAASYPGIATRHTTEPSSIFSKIS